jgi:hypothetical protein
MQRTSVKAPPRLSTRSSSGQWIRVELNELDLEIEKAQIEIERKQSLAHASVVSSTDVATRRPPPRMSKRQSSAVALAPVSEALNKVERELETAQAILEKKHTLLEATESMLQALPSAAGAKSSSTEGASTADGSFKPRPNESTGDGVAGTGDKMEELSSFAGLCAPRDLARVDEASDGVEDLREELAQSDIEVQMRLSEFCPDSVRESIVAHARESMRSCASMRTSANGSMASVTGSFSRRDSAAVASADGGGGGRLHAVCLELVETETRYTRDLALVVHTFVQGLRRAAPKLIQPLVSNAEQLLQLHTSLAERMSAATVSLRGVELADALGSELLSVSPFFVMYVTYCSNFMAGTELLCQAQKTNRELAKVIESTEAQITRRNVVEKG